MIVDMSLRKRVQELLNLAPTVERHTEEIRAMQGEQETINERQARVRRRMEILEKKARIPRIEND